METNTFQLGQTIYLDGHEMVITQTRVDCGVGGATGLIYLSDPILYQKDKLDREEKERLVRTQTQACESVTRMMNDESGH